MIINYTKKSIYDAVCLMAAAWDLFPRRFVANAWLKTITLALYQGLSIRKIVQSSNPTLFLCYVFFVRPCLKRTEW